jgi:hypothetical protein
MLRKTLIAAAIAVAMAGGTSAPARADVDITINLGYGGKYGRNISCRQGAWMVAERFNRVSIMSCAGRNYDYRGRRNGKWYHIKVSAYSGRIVDVQRIW